jgi:hypothetical protein
VPHPFAYFLAKGWETTNLKEQNHAVRDLGWSSAFGSSVTPLRFIRAVKVAHRADNLQADGFTNAIRAPILGPRWDAFF